MIDFNDLLLEYGITLEYGGGEFMGRPIRYLEEAGLFQVGDDDFDRWANSEDFEFEVWLPKGRRQFVRWIKEVKEIGAI